MTIETLAALLAAVSIGVVFTAPVFTIMRKREEVRLARQRQEERVLRMAARSVLVMDGQDMGFAVLDPELRYCYINKTLANLNGLSVEAHLGHHMAAILPELHAAVAPLFHMIASRQEPVVDMVRTIEVARGEVQFVFTYDVVMRRDESGNVCCFHAYVREVRPEDTLDRSARHYLRSAEEATQRLQAVATALMDGRGSR